MLDVTEKPVLEAGQTPHISDSNNVTVVIVPSFTVSRMQLPKAFLYGLKTKGSSGTLQAFSITQ